MNDPKLEVVNLQKKKETDKGVLTTSVNTLTLSIRILLFSRMWPTEKLQDDTYQVHCKQQIKYENVGIFQD